MANNQQNNGCVAVGRAVAFDTRDSIGRNFNCYQLYEINYTEKTKIKGNGVGEKAY